MAKKKKIRPKRFAWSKDQAKALKIEGKPNYEKISLTRDGVRVTNRGETPH